MRSSRLAVIGLAAAVAGSTYMARAQQPAPQQPMSFFITSVGLGQGANLGGIAGADKHCQTLAAASGMAGAGNREWRAAGDVGREPGDLQSEADRRAADHVHY